MKILLVNIFWGIVSLVIFGSGLIVPGLLIISIIIILLIFLWRFMKFLKSRTPNSQNIPEEILTDFQEAERRWTESDGQTEPHEIIWEIARSKQRGLRIPSKTSRETSTGELYTPYIKRSELQNNIASGVTNDKGRTIGSKRHHSKILFGRRIR